MNLKATVAASFLVLAAAGCGGMGGNASRDSAAAQSTAPMPPAVSFAQADLNGDARIDRHEFDLWVRKSDANAVSARAAAGGTAENDAFSAADTNANGVLTLDEWQAMIVTPSSASAAASPATGRRPPSLPPSPALGR